MDIEELTVLGESIEAAGMEGLLGASPAHVREELGIADAHIGGGIAFAMTHELGGPWNRTAGLGVDRPVDAEIVGDVVEFYRSTGVSRALVEIPPSRLPGDWDGIRARHGIRAEGSSIKLVRPGGQTDAGATELKVALVEVADRRAAGRVVVEAAGIPESSFRTTVSEVYAAAYDGDEMLTFAAWDGTEMVAVASVFVRGQVARFMAGATLPDYRGRGAHAALIAARAEAATARGVTWFFTEVAKPEPGTRNPSLNNFVRLGFEPLYERANWMWTSPDGRASENL